MVKILLLFRLSLWVAADLEVKELKSFEMVTSAVVAAVE